MTDNQQPVEPEAPSCDHIDVGLVSEIANDLYSEDQGEFIQGASATESYMSQPDMGNNIPQEAMMPESYSGAIAEQDSEIGSSITRYLEQAGAMQNPYMPGQGNMDTQMFGASDDLQNAIEGMGEQYITAQPDIASQSSVTGNQHPQTQGNPPASSGATSSAPGSENELQGVIMDIQSEYGTTQSARDTQQEYYFLSNEDQPEAATSTGTFDVMSVRRDFPILHQKVHGKQLIWLDNAATTQKPQSVIDTISHYYERDNSNVQRAAHALAARSTDAFEAARGKVQVFLGAASRDEIIFVRGTTEGINLIAQTYGKKNVGAGDEIIVTTLEHHANIVPWQLLAQAKGATIKVVPINDRGEIIMEEYAKLLGPRTKVVALAHVSNALGTVLPIREMANMAHAVGARVVVDGAQSVPHFRANVQALDADFYVFSGHKLFGPTGIGAVYGRKSLLDEMPPWEGGGNMIENVTFENTTYREAPSKFEAGTAHIAGAVGLGAAIDYLNKLGHENVAQYEMALLSYAREGLSQFKNMHHYGTAPGKVGVLSFNIDGIKSEDMGKFLDKEGIAVRAGHHCAQPTMARFGVTSMVRPSIAFYNTFEEIDVMIAVIHKAIRALK